MYGTQCARPHHPQELPLIDRALLQQLAHDHGFERVRFAEAGPTARVDAFERWLDAGFDADMHYLARERDARANPLLRLPEARTAMVLATPFAVHRPPHPGGLAGRVAAYAWGRDYHNLVGKQLKKLRSRLRELGCASWGAVDTGPILERVWAESAGLGGFGKNALNLIPGVGSRHFLAVLFLSVEVEPDPPLAVDPCKRCTRCLGTCPTQAFAAPHVVDARRCISYWTIEAAGLPPRELRPGFGDWVFGCDACQDICPHNHRDDQPHHPDLAPRHAWLDLPELLLCPDEALMDRFLGTPLRRPKAHGLKRNAAIVLGNLGDDTAVPALRHALSHPEAVVRGASLWALAQLGAPARDHRDSHPLVIAEQSAIHYAEGGGF